MWCELLRSGVGALYALSVSARYSCILKMSVIAFIITVCVRSVLRYHFKLAYVILQMPVKEFSGTHF